MKTIIAACVILISQNSFAQPKDSYVLEKREKSAKYFSKKELNLPTSAPKIKTIRQDDFFNSVQINTDINHNNTVGDAANEPSIAVNPNNPQQIAVGWRQFNTITNSFRLAGKSYSADGGKTWNYQDPFEPSVFRSDPVLASNAEGEFYYQSLRVDFNNQGNATNFNVDQWKSYDGGATWVEKTFAFGG
ncbi:MAG TPA: exo-alpha-sialidase, partial [Oceanospirillales bacterium]|nr:exo-alpha-sialidase [Oceanospirillales bacterium]